MYVFEYLATSAAKYYKKESWDCLKRTGEQAGNGIGLQQEPVDFPHIRKVETLMFVIWDQTLILVIWDLNSFILLGRHGSAPLQPIFRPCSIDIMYPREWPIAIPSSLMRVDEA